MQEISDEWDHTKPSEDASAITHFTHRLSLAKILAVAVEHVRRVRADQESQQDDRNTEETSLGAAADKFDGHVAAELATVMPSEMDVAGREGPSQSDHDPAAQSDANSLCCVAEEPRHAMNLDQEEGDHEEANSDDNVADVDTRGEGGGRHDSCSRRS